MVNQEHGIDGQIQLELLYVTFLTYEDISDVQAFAQLPIIIALAGKNNLISFLTGVPYQELNYLHRASGRLCLLCSWIHTIGWIDGAYGVG
jgi:hypothetical protein